MEVRGTTAVVFKIGTLIESYEADPPRLYSHFGVQHIDTKKVVQRAIVAKVEKVDFSTLYKVTSVIFWADEAEEEKSKEDDFAWLEELSKK